MEKIRFNSETFLLGRQKRDTRVGIDERLRIRIHSEFEEVEEQKGQRNSINFRQKMRKE